MSQRTYSVYMLEREDYRAFYAGITCRDPKKRLSNHVSEARRGKNNLHKNSIILKTIAALGHLPMTIIKSGLTRDEAKRVEIYTVAAFRQYNIKIANLSAGGESMSGHSHSPETRAKIAATLRGRKRSPEAIAKTAATHRGRKRPPEAKARMKAAIARPDVIARRVATRKVTMARPGYQERNSAAVKAACARPDVIARRKAAAKARWARPEYRAAMLAALG